MNNDIHQVYRVYSVKTPTYESFTDFTLEERTTAFDRFNDLMENPTLTPLIVLHTETELELNSIALNQ